jgi:hypothetical protein
VERVDVASLADLRAGGKPVLASVLAKLESSPDDSNLATLLAEA